MGKVHQPRITRWIKGLKYDIERETKETSRLASRNFKDIFLMNEKLLRHRTNHERELRLLIKEAEKFQNSINK